MNHSSIEYQPRISPRRRYAAANLRIERQAGADGAPDSSQIVGHAAVFNQWTTLYEGRYYTWREVIRPGTFQNAIGEKQDVRSLFNHDANFVLGRTTAGTLHLSEDATGLLSRTDAPDTQTIRDLVLSPIGRGDITGMSFGFLPRKADKTVRTETEDSDTVDMGGLVVTLRYEGEHLTEEWEVRDADLYDVSPVTFPAYEGTDVALRSAPELRERIAEMDRPHIRKVEAPIRDSFKTWLKSL